MKGIIFNDGYRSKNGNPTFIYKVIGATPAQIEAFKAFRGGNYRNVLEEVNGEIVEYPLIWSIDGLQDEVAIRQTPKGDFQIDNSQMLRLESVMRKSKVFEQAIASEFAKALIGNMSIGSSKRSTSNDATVNTIKTGQVKQEGVEDLDNLGN
jgi:hypothetical protein